MFSLASLLLLSTLHKPAPAVQADVFDVGIYVRLEATKQVGSISSASTNPIIYNVDDLFIKPTRRIPIVPNLSFGFSFSVPLPDGKYPVVWQVEHPPMTRPDGVVSTGYQEPRTLHVLKGYQDSKTYGFDQPYEMVEGHWVFRYLYQGKVLLEQSFDTYRPSPEEEKAWRELQQVVNEDPSPGGEPEDEYEDALDDVGHE